MENLKLNKKWFVGLLISLFWLTGCGGVDFEATDDNSVLGLGTSQFFPLNNKVDIFTQNDLLSNNIGVSFHVYDNNNMPLQNLKKSDFSITENGQAITDYTFSSARAEVSKADIVFVLDKTGSMGDEINSVKDNVRGFVEQLKSVNILANLCLVTFNDRVQDECDEFQDDDPATPENENIEDFLDKLERLEVKGGGDDPENQLQGLMSAANVTPWRPGAQRLTIMITDESFHDSTSPGDAGANAQNYEDVYNTLQTKHISSFIVAPKMPGYSAPYNGVPALALPNNFFNIDHLLDRNSFIVGSDPIPVNAKKSLKDILSEIATSLGTVYTIKYDVSDNELDPNLPAKKRDVVIKTPKNSENVVSALPITSTFPDGHPVARSEWKLSTEVSTNDINVYINNIKIENGYLVKNGMIVFDTPPELGSQVKVEYNKGNVSERIRLTQVKLSRPNFDNYRIIVYYNEIKANEADFTLEEDVSKRFVLLTVQKSTLSDLDKYSIVEKQGLYVTFKIEKINLSVE